MDIDPECGVYFSLKDGVALCRLMSKLRPGEAVPAPSESSLPYKQVRVVSLARFELGTWEACTSACSRVLMPLLLWNFPIGRGV